MNTTHHLFSIIRSVSQVIIISVVMVAILALAVPQKSHAQSLSMVSETMLGQLFSALQSLQGLLAQSIAATTSCVKSGNTYQHGGSYTESVTRTVGDNDREIKTTYYCNKGSWTTSKPAPLPATPVAAPVSTPVVTPTAPVTTPSTPATTPTASPAVVEKPPVTTPTTPATPTTPVRVTAPVSTPAPVATTSVTPTVTPAATGTCTYDRKVYKNGESYTTRTRANRDSEYVTVTNYCTNGAWTKTNPATAAAVSTPVNRTTLGTHYPNLKPGEMVFDILDYYDGAAAVSVYTKNNKRTACKPADFLPINSISRTPKGGKQLTSTLLTGRSYGVGGSSCEEVVGFVTTVTPGQINAKWAPGTYPLNYKDFNGKTKTRNLVITDSSKLRPNQGNLTAGNITLAAADKQTIAVALDVTATGTVYYWNNANVTIEVDWGDGKKDTYSNVKLTHVFGPNPYYAIHTYANSGTYTPKVTFSDPYDTQKDANGVPRKFIATMTPVILPLTISEVSNTSNPQYNMQGGQRDTYSGRSGSSSGGNQNGNNRGGINANESGLDSGFGIAY